MKVAVLNYTGSVGKTVVASHLLAPRMNGAQIFAVESTNETGADLGLNVDQLRGEHFGRLFRELLTRDDAIVDVGASNIEDFLTHMMRYEGAHEEMSYFVLPVINTGKAQRETIKTVAALAALGWTQTGYGFCSTALIATWKTSFPRSWPMPPRRAKYRPIRAPPSTKTKSSSCWPISAPPLPMYWPTKLTIAPYCALPTLTITPASRS